MRAAPTNRGRFVRYRPGREAPLPRNAQRDARHSAWQDARWHIVAGRAEVVGRYGQDSVGVQRVVEIELRAVADAADRESFAQPEVQLPLPLEQPDRPGGHERNGYRRL